MEALILVMTLFGGPDEEPTLFQRVAMQTSAEGVVVELSEDHHHVMRAIRREDGSIEIVCTTKHEYEKTRVERQKEKN